MKSGKMALLLVLIALTILVVRVAHVGACLELPTGENIQLYFESDQLRRSMRLNPQILYFCYEVK
jgi:hypothetical protein